MIPCPYDNTETFFKVYTIKIGGETFSLVSCTACGLEMVNPQPTSEQLDTFYNTDYYGDKMIKFVPIIQWLRNLSVQKKVRRILNLYSQKNKKTGRIIDIGCADGNFLFNIKKRKWDTSGLEISKSIHQTNKNNDLNIVIGDITTQKFPDKSYDIITLWHVFEHLPEPNIYLNEIQRIITPDGLLVITIPNIDSWQARLFGKNWFHRDIPRHLFHYTPSTLKKILEKHQLHIETIEHFSLEYNPFGFIQSFYNYSLSDNNEFYEYLKNIQADLKYKNIPRLLLCLALLPILIIPAVILSILESVAKHGGTIKVYIRKK